MSKIILISDSSNGLVWFMVFNATVNNISAISWRSIYIGGGNRRNSPTCRKSL